MTVAPLEQNCSCNGSGWITPLDRARYAPAGDVDVVEFSRCPCSASVDLSATPCIGLVAADDQRRRRLEVELTRVELVPAVSVRAVEELFFAPATSFDVIVISWERRDSAATLVAPAFRVLRSRFPRARLIGITDDTRSRVVRGAVEEGADGVLGDLDARRSLDIAVRAVHAGFVVLPQEVRTRFAEPPLTRRERQVLACVVAGQSNLEIAVGLDLAESTVKGHISAAFAKIGVRSRAEAAGLLGADGRLETSTAERVVVSNAAGV